MKENSRESTKITEVGPRDGLQNEKNPVPTTAKFEFIQKLVNAGLHHIEATSFVRKDAIPQLGDAEELSKLLNPSKSSTNFSCLTPNIKGYEMAMKAGYKEVAVFTAVSNSFTKKNINKTVSESFEDFEPIFVEANRDKIKVRGYISTVIACPYEGWIDPESVIPIVSHLLEKGVHEISLGETIGKGTPGRVEALLDALLKKYPREVFAVHFHDTYGMAIANIQKSLEMGIRSFDSSAGGLGGCPYAPGASGNLATEDLVYLLETDGYKTNIDLEKLLEADIFMEKTLGRNLSSKTYLARIGSKI